MKTYAFMLLLVVGASFALCTGVLFWSDREFYWSGEPVDEMTRKLLGWVFIIAGALCVYDASRILARSWASIKH